MPRPPLWFFMTPSAEAPSLKLGDFLRFPLARAILALALIFAIGGIVAPLTVTPAVLSSILPFVGILGVAAFGQHLVIQQRGFDLSVAGIISLAAVVVTRVPDGAPEVTLLLVAIAAAVLVGAAAGLLNGVIINRLGVSPLVTTIAMNALLLGFTFYFSGGVPKSAPPSLTGLVGGRTVGIPNPFLFALFLAAVSHIVITKARIGRNFIAVGVNPVAARALAIPVDSYQIGTYVVAGAFYALAAILLAGFLKTPTPLSGVPYMLTTVAAVVTGGNSLSGDRMDILATLIGSVFLIYLNQLVLSLGLAQSMQSIVQALIILLGVAVPALLRRPEQ
jgi:ribose transport system permease protein